MQTASSSLTTMTRGKKSLGNNEAGPIKFIYNNFPSFSIFLEPHWCIEREDFGLLV